MRKIINTLRVGLLAFLIIGATAAPLMGSPLYPSGGQSRNLSFFKPRGVPKINFGNPITKGLSFFHNCEQLNPIFITRGTAPFALASGDFSGGKGGKGLSGSSAGVLDATASGTTYNPNATVGTVVVFTEPGFSPTDGVQHEAFSMTVTTLNTNYFQLLKFSDNQMYMGFLTGGTGNRVITSASGLWAAGDMVSFGYSWNPAHVVKAYVKGKLIGSNSGSVNAPTVNSGFMNIGAYHGPPGGTIIWPWNTATKNAASIYYVAIWDRELSPAEFLKLQTDPYTFLVFPQDSVMSTIRGVISAIKSNLLMLVN